MDINRDPLTKAVYDGILRGIEVTLGNGCYNSALILILAGVDQMANLDMQASQQEVKREDFMRWVDEYIKIESKEQITPEEVYSARCAVVHTYGVESTITKSGKARMVLYMLGAYPPIWYDPKKDKDVVMVDLLALANAFFKGVDQFLSNVRADPLKSKIVEARARKLLQVIPFEPKSDNPDVV